MYVFSFVSCVYPGKPFLSSKHHPSSDHEAEGDPLHRVHSLHEGGEGHPHPHPAAGSPVHPHAVETRGMHRLRLRFLQQHLLPLPGMRDTHSQVTHEKYILRPEKNFSNVCSFA